MKKNLLLMLTVALCCAGCVTGAVNPFYTPEAVVPSGEFEGNWYGLEKDDKGKEIKTPLKIEGERLIMEDEAGAIKFFKVDEQLFADMQLDKEEGDEENPPHLLFKIIQGAGKLTFIPLDYTWLEDEIGAGNIDLPLIKDEDKRSTLFTASPPQWLEFIKTHKDDDYAFPFKEQFVLVQ